MAAHKVSGVSRTAFGVARLRALEQRRTTPLFNDPHAELFVTAAGYEVVQPEDPAHHVFGMQVAIRTRFYDDYLLAAAARGCRQIVLLAAGLDTRAFRLDWPQDTRFFELDLPELLDFKEQVLANQAPRTQRTILPVDLREAWPARLIDAIQRVRGIRLEDRGVNRQNNALQAWSWMSETFSWVEPTACCLVALKKARAAGFTVDARRIEDGEAVLFDRCGREGGWNYGNANMLGQELPAYVPTTALGLLALGDHRSHDAVRRSLDFLEREALTERSSVALSLALVALRVFDRPADHGFGVTRQIGHRRNHTVPEIQPPRDLGVVGDRDDVGARADRGQTLRRVALARDGNDGVRA